MEGPSCLLLTRSFRAASWDDTAHSSAGQSGLPGDLQGLSAAAELPTGAAQGIEGVKIRRSRKKTSTFSMSV